jgi:hypothetical protein
MNRTNLFGKASRRMVRALSIILLTAPLFICSEPAQALVGSSTTDVTNYPHVGILLVNRKFPLHPAPTCSVALISPTTAVTTATCVGGPPGEYTVEFGNNNGKICSDAPNPYCVERNVTSISRHPYFDPNAAGLPNDIAVIHFATIAFNLGVQPI